MGPGTPAAGLAWDERRNRMKGTEMHDVMVAGGRQGAKGAPPQLKPFWNTSDQAMQEGA